jgi:hypothetical protein
MLYIAQDFPGSEICNAEEMFSFPPAMRGTWAIAREESKSTIKKTIQRDAPGFTLNYVNPIGIQYFGFEMRRFIFYPGYLLSSVRVEDRAWFKKSGFY